MRKTNKLHAWFLQLFDERKDHKGFVKCFECGKAMHESHYRELSICYSHLLEKRKHPSLAMEDDNVVIVHPDCHTLFTMRPKKAINQYNKLQTLKDKYNV